MDILDKLIPLLTGEPEQLEAKKSEEELKKEKEDLRKYFLQCFFLVLEAIALGFIVLFVIISIFI